MKIDEKLLFRVNFHLVTDKGDVSFRVQNKFAFGYVNITAGLDLWKTLPADQARRVVSLAEGMYFNDVSHFTGIPFGTDRSLGSYISLRIVDSERIDWCGNTLSTFTP